MFQWNTLIIPAKREDSFAELSTQSTVKKFNTGTNISEESNNLADIEPIIKRGKIRVAMLKGDTKPLCLTAEDGSTYGIEYNIAKEIAQALGVELELNRTVDTNNELVDLLASGEVDIIVSFLSPTTDRAKKIEFSNPYYTLPFGIMVNKKELVSNGIERNPLNYLKKNTVKIAALKGTSHVQKIKELFPMAEVIEKDSRDECTKAVMNGEIFGYLCSRFEFVLDYINNPSANIYTSVFLFSDVNDCYCVGVNPGNPHLLNFINTYIATKKALSHEEVEENL